ncbi:uncharacterized protein LOC110460943 [Mizuhopecten yessoensis]|uniref:uncharacterized protein LOC110460943 n=1 Tax=Mizuhopecten yessoensis TaxID=6573 RepID=UPI000B45B513|nr:uncharacterized protein LOC110460943 [Mizuhopecten yessoensis]
MSKVKHKRRTSKKSPPMAFSSDSPSVDSVWTVDMGVHVDKTSPGGSNSQQFSDVSTAETGNIPRYLNTLSHNTDVSPGHSGQTTSESISTRKRKRDESDSGRRDNPKYRRHRKQSTGADRDNVATKTEKNRANTEDSNVTGKRKRDDTEPQNKGKHKSRGSNRHTGGTTVDHVTAVSQTAEGTRYTDSTPNSPVPVMDFDKPLPHMVIKAEPISDDQYTHGAHESSSDRRKRYSKRKHRKDYHQHRRRRNKSPPTNKNMSEGTSSHVVSGSGNETSLSVTKSCSSVFGIKLKTEQVTIKEEQRSDPDYSSSGESENTQQHGIRESSRLSKLRSNPQRVKLERSSVVNTSVKREPRTDPHYSSTEEPDSKNRHWNEETLRQPETSSKPQSVKLELSTVNTTVKREPSSDPRYSSTREHPETRSQHQSVKLEPSTVNTTIKREPSSDPRYSSTREHPETRSQQQGVKLEPSTVNTTMKLEPMSDNLSSSTGIHDENGAVGFSEQARTSLQQQNGQDAISGSTDDDDDEREFQQFRLRMARRTDAKQHLKDTCSEIENYEFCTNVKAYLNNILENLPPEEYDRTAIMTEDPFFNERMVRIRDEPFLTTLFAMLHHQGVITREDICCIMHPLSSGSATVFNLVEVLKRKPNGRKAFETAAQDCLQEELLHEDLFDLARFSQSPTLYYGDLPKLEQYFAHKYSSEIENWKDNKYSLLHNAAAEGNFTLYKQLEMFFLLLKDDQEKHLYIQRHRDAQKNTILHVAVECGNDEVCGYLCSQYPFLTRCRNVMNQEPIHLAIANNKTNTKCLKHLMESNGSTYPQVDSVINGVAAQNIQRLLVLAYTRDNVEAVKYIFTKYPSLKSQKGFQGRMPIHSAAACGGLECFKYIEQLLLTGIDSEHKCTIMKELTENNCSNILHIACESGSIDMISYIIQQYTQLLHSKGHRGREPIHYAVQRQGSLQSFVNVFDALNENRTNAQKLDYLIKARDRNEDIVLHLACLLGRTHIVKYLLTRYPSLIEVRGFMGRQPLHHAASKDGSIGCFKFILDTLFRNKTVDDQLDYLKIATDYQNNTVLHLACLRERKDCVKYFLKKYPSLVDVKGYKGRHLLHTAANKDGTFACFKYILDIVLDKTVEDPIAYITKTRDDERNTVLHVACLGGKKNIVEYLLTEYPSLVDVKGYKGRHLLHTAANKDGTFECFKYILDIVLANTVEDPVEI